MFGRKNYIGTVIWQHSVQVKGYSGSLSLGHNYIHGYTKSQTGTLHDLERTEKHNINYKNPDNDPKGSWRSGDVRNALVRPNLMYDITTPSGKVIQHPKKGWRFSRDTFQKELKSGKIIFSDDETRVIRKIYLSDQVGRVADTIWGAKEVGTTREANAELKKLALGELFATPKPERLIERLIHLASKPGDLVLDSFLGSGTTAAVAHKMGRRWIGIEMGDHAESLCKPRLDKVVCGEQGGISEAVGWQGGGGYRYFRLGPPTFDATGRIEPEIGFDALAAHIWFAETGHPVARRVIGTSPVLGVHNGTAYALLYNGILGDRSPAGGNVLTGPLFTSLAAELPAHEGPWMIYGEACRMSPARLKAEGITFKQTPYDVKAR